MLDITKYYNEEELKKKKGNNLVQTSVRAMSNDELYDQKLIEGGIGFEPSMKHIMDTAAGKDPSQLSMHHNVTSNGMQY